MERKITLLPGNIVYGGDRNCDIAKNYGSLGQFCLDKLKQHSDATLFVNGLTGVQYTGKMLYDSIVRMADVLAYLGIQQNDKIGLCSENSIEFVIILYACMGLNATVTPINVTYTERELKHTLELTKPKIIFASRTSLKRVVSVSTKLKFVEHIIATDSKPKIAGVLSFQNLMKDQNIPPSSRTFVATVDKKEDVALIFYSSGTTGEPKGVQLTQHNFLSFFDLILGAPIQPAGFATYLSAIPWTHIYGTLGVLRTCVVGIKTVFLPRFQPKVFLTCIQRYRVTHAALVPPLVIFLAKDPIVKNYDLSSLMMVFSGGGALKSQTITQLKERLNIPLVMQGYGLTETTFGVLVQDPISASYLGSVGLPTPGTYIKVVDPESGEALGFHKLGEICIKGDYIMKGYINDDKATEQTVKEGWLHTGDIGYYDENFNFYIEDRLKELIKYKANQVPPAELEAILLSHDDILDAAVVGKPDEMSGELPTAFVVKRPGSSLDEYAVMKFVEKQVSPAKKLRGGVIFVSEIPKTLSGKILRRHLKNQLIQKSKL